MAGCVVSTLRRKRSSISPVRAARQLVMLVATAASLFTGSKPATPIPSPQHSPTHKVPQLNLNKDSASPESIAPRRISVRGIAPYISPRSKNNGRNSRSNSHSSHGSAKMKSPTNRSRSPSGHSNNFTFTNPSIRRIIHTEPNPVELSNAFSIQPDAALQEFSEMVAKSNISPSPINCQSILPFRRKSNSMKTEQSGSAHPSDESDSMMGSSRRPDSAPNSSRAVNYEISGESYHNIFSNITNPTKNNDAYIKSVMSTPDVSRHGSKTNSRKNSYVACDTILISGPNKSSPLFTQLSQHHEQHHEQQPNLSQSRKLSQHIERNDDSPEKSISPPPLEFKPESPMKDKSQIRIKLQPNSFEKIRDLNDDSPRAHSARETTARDLRRSKELAATRRQESLNIHARKLRVDHLREMLNRERGLVDNLIVEFLY